MKTNSTIVGSPSDGQIISYDAASGKYKAKAAPTSNGVNAQTGTSYTIVASDSGKLVTLNSASAVAVSITAAATLGSTFQCPIENLGAGTVTLTPASGTIDGASSLTLSQNQGIALYSDGSNFFTQRGAASGGGAGVSSLDSITGAVSLVAGTNVTITDNSPSAGQITIAASGSGGGGDLVKLSEVVTSGSQASVTFSSFPSSYRDLIIVVRGRGTASQYDDAIVLQFNGDSGSNYDYIQAFLATSYGNSSHQGQTSLFTVQLPSATATANFAGACEITVADYKGTTFYKSVYAIGHDWWSSQHDRGMVTAGRWQNTSAITSILVAWGAGNFVDNSVVTLYGRN